MFLDGSQASARQAIKPRLQSAACHGSLAQVTKVVVRKFCDFARYGRNIDCSNYEVNGIILFKPTTKSYIPRAHKLITCGLNYIFL